MPRSVSRVPARFTRLAGLLTIPLALWLGAGTAIATPDAYGIDVSHYNTLTDPAAVRGNGISFAYVKATEGTRWIDATYASTTARLRGAGLLIGAYHYADAGDCAVQARWFAAHSSGAQLIPALDMEDAGQVSSADACVTAFYDALRAPRLLVYANETWWNSYLHPARWGGRQITGWIASYTGQPGAPAGADPVWVLHQHSDRGVVPGFAGLVDRDAIMPGHTLAELITSPMAPLPPAPITPPSGGILYIVRRGDTLSAIGRAYGVPFLAIAARNGITAPYVIYPGQRLIISGPAAPWLYRTYMVKRDDTLYTIGRAHGVPWRTLAAENHIHPPWTIYPGERLSY